MCWSVFQLLCISLIKTYVFQVASKQTTQIFYQTHYHRIYMVVLILNMLCLGDVLLVTSLIIIQNKFVFQFAMIILRKQVISIARSTTTTLKERLLRCNIAATKLMASSSTTTVVTHSQFLTVERQLNFLSARLTDATSETSIVVKIIISLLMSKMVHLSSV